MKIQDIGDDLSYIRIDAEERLDAEKLEVEVKDGKNETKTLWTVIENGRSLKIDLGECHFPIKAIEIKPTRNNCKFEDANQALSNLFPSNNKAYESSFLRKKMRTQDARLNFFIGAQVQKYFTGKIAYRVGATVVMAYKAVELYEDKYINRARASAEESFGLVSNCPASWHPRLNGEHLKFALLCAAYHLAIVQKDKAYLEECVGEMVQYDNSLTSYFTPAYPISHGVLMSAAVKVLSEKSPELQKEVELLEGLFKRAVADSTINRLILFQELSVIHKTAVLCQKLSRGQVELEVAFDHAVRVGRKRAQMMYSDIKSIYGHL